MPYFLFYQLIWYPFALVRLSLALSLTPIHAFNTPYKCVYICILCMPGHPLPFYFLSFLFYTFAFRGMYSTHCFPRCVSLIWSDDVCDYSRQTHLPISISVWHSKCERVSARARERLFNAHATRSSFHMLAFRCVYKRRV